MSPLRRRDLDSQIRCALQLSTNNTETALEVKVPVALVVFHATLIFFAHRVLVRAHGGSGPAKLAFLVGEVSDELRNSEVPQLSVPEEIVLHFVQVELGIRVLWNISFVVGLSFNAAVGIYCELRPHVLCGDCTSDHVKTKQPVVAHTHADISRLQEALHRVCFTARGR